MVAIYGWEARAPHLLSPSLPSSLSPESLPAPSSPLPHASSFYVVKRRVAPRMRICSGFLSIAGAPHSQGFAFRFSVYCLWQSLFCFLGTSPVTLTVKCLPAMWETGVRSLGWEDPLEKKMATHCSILAWKIPWMEKPCNCISGTSKVLHLEIVL